MTYGDPSDVSPRNYKCLSTAASSIVTNAWWAQAEHLTLGFSHMPRRHSLAHAGE